MEMPTVTIERRRSSQPHFSVAVWQLSAIALFAALFFGLFVSYVALVRNGDAGPRQSDFVAYYGGARLVALGHSSSLYNFTVLGRFEAALVHPLHVRDGVLPFIYPPYLAVTLAPLAALSYNAAYFAWLVLNCCLVGIVLYALCRYAGLRGRAAALFWVASLSFLPVFVGVVQGQTSPLLLALTTLAVLALVGGHEGIAGAALAVALVKPPYVVPFLLVLLVRRRWRALLAFAAVAGLLTAVPTMLIGLSSDRAYLQTLVRATGWHNQFGYGAQWNQSLSGFTELLIPGRAATLVALVTGVAFLCLLGWSAHRSARIDEALALAALVALLISPHVLIHDLSLLVLPVAVALKSRPLHGPTLAAILVAGYLALLAGLRIAPVLHLQLSVIAVAGLAVWLAYRMTDETRASASRMAVANAATTHR